MTELNGDLLVNVTVRDNSGEQGEVDMSLRKKWVSAPAAPVHLNETQLKLRDYIQQKLNVVLKSFGDFAPASPKDLEAMAQAAHELHMSLKKMGTPPKHHKDMLKNRECSPDTIEFYRHVHPVQDLLAFVADGTENSNPAR